MPFIQVVDVTKQLNLVDDTKQKISIKAQPSSVFIQKGKVIVTLQGSIGRVAITQYDAYMDRTLLLFESYKHKTNQRFWAYTIQQKFEIEKQRAPGGTIKTITKEALAKFEVSLPNYEEQKAIGNFFENLDNLITLHQCKRVVLIIFVRMIDHVIYTISWEQCKLNSLGNTFTGLSGKTKDDFGHGEGRFVTYMNVFSNSVANSYDVGIIEIDESQNKVKYGDVFFTTSSETPEEVGMSSVWLENTDNVYLNSFCFGYRPTVEIDPFYLAYMLRSPGVRNKIKLLAQGISRYNISKTKVMEIDVPIPKDGEQKKIGKLFLELDNLITLHQCKLKTKEETC